jgi:hypothetical protein
MEKIVKFEIDEQEVSKLSEKGIRFKICLIRDFAKKWEDTSEFIPMKFIGVSE